MTIPSHPDHRDVPDFGSLYEEAPGMVELWTLRVSGRSYSDLTRGSIYSETALGSLFAALARALGTDLEAHGLPLTAPARLRAEFSLEAPMVRRVLNARLNGKSYAELDCEMGSPSSGVAGMVVALIREDILMDLEKNGFEVDHLKALETAYIEHHTAGMTMH